MRKRAETNPRRGVAGSRCCRPRWGVPARRLLLAGLLAGAGLAAIAYFRLFHPWPAEHGDGGSGTRPATAVDGDRIAIPEGPLPDAPSAVVEEAVRLAEGLLRRFPKDPDAYEVNARVHFWLGDSAAAIKSWEQGLALAPGYAHAYHGLGLAAAKRGDHALAAELFRKALELAPASVEPRLELASALANLGKWEEVVGRLEPGLRTTPNPAPVLMLLGKAYLHLDRLADAKRSFAAVLQVYPQHANARFGFATACARLKETNQAQEEMEKFRTIRSEERQERQARQGNYDDLGEMCAALAALYTTAGEVCSGGGNLDEAERFWRRAAALAPQDIASRECLVRRYMRSGRMAEAIQTLGQLAAINPANPAYSMELRRLGAGLINSPQKAHP
ncbi:MAG: tetratricopeptide repeat protein [Planctomycetota bacterium]|nr:tetratricopeptide repeat protein [Planctomycetota bacterium]